ncbi:MAG: glycoside hydrolase family 2, partial [Bacteroidetes bacterium]|nr:glycoside hydrolase family 2 [Bacteroidota bacterium]
GPDEKKWSVQSWMDIGDQAYADSKTCFSQLPPVLFGADWIRTPDNNKGYPGAAFNVDVASDVYVAMNSKPENLPTWLRDYSATGLSLQTDENGGTNFALYKKRFASNSQVVLGSADQKYTVAVLPVTTLPPAIDLKKSIKYNVDNATVRESVAHDTLDGKKVVRFTKPAGGEVTFSIAPGVADKYDLRFKYHNDSAKTLTVNMQLQAADGTVMKTEELGFKPVKKNKTGTLATTTGTSINAGNYKVILRAVDAEGLVISGLEMQ